MLTKVNLLRPAPQLNNDGEMYDSKKVVDTSRLIVGKSGSPG